ncbi:trypsin-like serine peptidase [Streptomyces bohaiensis]|uniref:trypsin-like serine peptidase n=1 Tax=Streptomyces bohaiensis TaxID=1431344 RepID=UPI003B8058BD
MSSIRRGPGRRRAAGAAIAAVTVLALTATACGPGDDSGDQGKNPTEDAAGERPGGGDRLGELLDRLPIEVDVEQWKDGAWADWDSENWLREAGEYIGIIIEDFWDRERMEEAGGQENSVDEDDIEEEESAPETGDPADDRGVTDPFPAPYQADRAATPYSQNNPGVGKLFFETPEGTGVCSAAVVQDPDNPGASNLVATAGHCVHAGVEGGWFRQVMFVPAYNDGGQDFVDQPAENPFEEVAPFGLWWAADVATTNYWIENGTMDGGNGAHQDFAVMRVEQEEGDGSSLEEQTGVAYEIDFDAPAVAGLGTLQNYGYPQSEPFDGEVMHSCTGDPTRLSLDAAEPVMYVLGCTMTAGSSGGPWLTADGGEPRLVSVNSIGPVTSTWLAGPRLDASAEEVFDVVRRG